jgi:hypothetical protein
MTLLSLIVGPKHSILGPHEQLGPHLQVLGLKLYVKYLLNILWTYYKVIQAILLYFLT